MADNCNDFIQQDKTLDTDLTFSRCPLLSLVVTKTQTLTMCRIIKPFVRHLDVLGNAVEVVDRDSSLIPRACDLDRSVPPYTVSRDQMSAPAIAVMLFLPEFGRSRAEKVKLKFGKNPWHLHHSIQLQNHKSSNIIGKQDFHFLSRNYPLWSVCTAPQTSRQLRINIFVRRYSAMVEFYRLVTGSEMESSKPGFCVFSLNTQVYGDGSSFPSQHPEPSTSCELSLKQCPHINPFPLTDAYLTFPVNNLVSLRTVLHTYIRPLTLVHHLVHDPDGNPVILYVTEDSPSVGIPHTSSIRAILAASKGCVQDKASVRSDSLDSGRYSDFDTTWSTELDQCMAQLFPNDRLGQDSIEHADDRSVLFNRGKGDGDLSGQSDKLCFEDRVSRVSVGHLPLVVNCDRNISKERSRHKT